MPVTFSTYPLRTARRPNTYAVLKSLVNSETAIPVAGQLPGQDEAQGQIVINFPCMPDTVELSRRANYKNMVHAPVIPDGLHFYESTEPLQIPVSFTLHGYDEEYCGSHGPLMLLSIAAKLHALTMPIVPEKSFKGGKIGAATWTLPPPPAHQLGEQAGEWETKRDAEAARARADFDRGTYEQDGKLYFIPALTRFAFPPACQLDIMLAQLGGPGGANASNDGVHSLGICCKGFVSDVRVVFKGPWLQGSFREPGLRNLPSAAEFSFTFVHQPGYTNNILGGGVMPVITTAKDIYDRLYNTIDLTGGGAGQDYVGIDSEGIPKPPSG